MAVDFTVLERHLAEIAQVFDHRLLNDVAPFTEVNPTAENIGAFFWQRLQEFVPGLAQGRSARLAEVTVRENDRTAVTFVDEE
jgi:6-pyruvoyltetrahydropterin/6-carboxytetrahydropterin synthase